MHGCVTHARAGRYKESGAGRSPLCTCTLFIETHEQLQKQEPITAVLLHNHINLIRTVPLKLWTLGLTGHSLAALSSKHGVNLELKCRPATTRALIH